MTVIRETNTSDLPHPLPFEPSQPEPEPDDVSEYVRLLAEAYAAKPLFA